MCSPAAPVLHQRPKWLGYPFRGCEKQAVLVSPKRCIRAENRSRRKNPSQSPVPVSRAVDHAADNQRLPRRTQLLRRLPHDLGDVSRPMGTWTASRHRVQIGPLRFRQPLVSRPEEVLVQASDRGFARSCDIVLRDRRDPRRVPGLVSPFLEEIRIALSLADDRCDRLVVELDIRLCGRLRQSALSLDGVQRPDSCNPPPAPG